MSTVCWWETVDMCCMHKIIIKKNLFICCPNFYFHIMWNDKVNHMLLLMMMIMVMMCKVSTLFSRWLRLKHGNVNTVGRNLSHPIGYNYKMTINHIVHLSPMIKLSPVYKYICIGSFEFSPSYPRGQEFYQVWFCTITASMQILNFLAYWVLIVFFYIRTIAEMESPIAAPAYLQGLYF
jgi:hypothetical protein